MCNSSGAHENHKGVSAWLHSCTGGGGGCLPCIGMLRAVSASKQRQHAIADPQKQPSQRPPRFISRRVQPIKPGVRYHQHGTGVSGRETGRLPYFNSAYFCSPTRYAASNEVCKQKQQQRAAVGFFCSSSLRHTVAIGAPSFLIT